MPRAYTKVEILSEEVFRRKKAGETNRAIAESYGLTLKQIKKLITRQNNKAKKIWAVAGLIWSCQSTEQRPSGLKLSRNR